MDNEFTKDNAYATRCEHYFADLYEDVWAGEVGEILRVKKSKVWQKRGIDTILLMDNGKQIYFDEKVRRADYNDILLEEWSNEGRQKIGWAFDHTKWTDYIAYLIPVAKTCFLLPFDLLRRTCDKYKDTWRHSEEIRYPIKAENPGYVTVSFAIEYGTLCYYMAQTQLVKIHTDKKEVKK